MHRPFGEIAESLPDGDETSPSRSSTSVARSS
jgi:hypothetical protein